MFDSLTDQRWESAPVLGNLAQAHVDGLNGVGGVDHLADFRSIAANLGVSVGIVYRWCHESVKQY